MHKIVISDTSSLILFQKIEELELLEKLYKQIYTTPEVAEEYGLELPKWIIIKKVKDTKYQNLLNTQIDLGEASAMALAIEINCDLIIIDDLKARKLAKQLNLKITGSLGIITKAKEKNIIENIKPILDKILKTNFRISKVIINELLRINNEI